MFNKNITNALMTGPTDYKLKRNCEEIMNTLAFLSGNCLRVLVFSKVNIACIYVDEFTERILIIC